MCLFSTDDSKLNCMTGNYQYIGTSNSQLFFYMKNKDGYELSSITLDSFLKSEKSRAHVLKKIKFKADQLDSSLVVNTFFTESILGLQFLQPGQETTTLTTRTHIYDVISKKTNDIISKTQARKSDIKLIKRNKSHSVFFIGYEQKFKKNCLFDLNLRDEHLEKVYCHVDLESFALDEKHQVFVVKKKVNNFFDSSTEEIKDTQFNLTIEKISNNKVTPIISITPERKFINTNCGQKKDISNIRSYVSSGHMDLIFEQTGRIMSHNFMPVNNAKVNTIGLFSFPIKATEKLIYREMSEPGSDNQNRERILKVSLASKNKAA